MRLKLLKNKAEKDIRKSQTLKELNQVYKKYLTSRGELGQILSSLKKLSLKKRAVIGRQANQIKKALEKEIKNREKILKEKFVKNNKMREWIDVTLPGKKIIPGHLHPLTLTKKRVEEIFQSMGFSVVEGPEVESEWYNFDALNIPKEHPARDMWNTLWLKGKDLLMRTHTSPVQIHYMEKHNPPLRIIVPGRIFRREATDASHEINFYQVEGLMVGEDVSVGNFKAILQRFFENFFSKPVKIRLRPSYFPFTEPSFEVDTSCLVCGGKGCSVCSQSGWLEMMGAGMVHPHVFKAVGLNPKNWQGFAFGMGMDRLAMMKYRIPDIRLFYGGDLRFLEQF